VTITHAGDFARDLEAAITSHARESRSRNAHRRLLSTSPLSSADCRQLSTETRATAPSFPSDRRLSGGRFWWADFSKLLKTLRRRSREQRSTNRECSARLASARALRPLRSREVSAEPPQEKEQIVASHRAGDPPSTDLGERPRQTAGPSQASSPRTDGKNRRTRTYVSCRTSAAAASFLPATARSPPAAEGPPRPTEAPHPSKTPSETDSFPEPHRHHLRNRSAVAPVCIGDVSTVEAARHFRRGLRLERGDLGAGREPDAADRRFFASERSGLHRVRVSHATGRPGCIDLDPCGSGPAVRLD
jgi:hypothetical protein